MKTFTQSVINGNSGSGKTIKLMQSLANFESNGFTTKLINNINCNKPQEFIELLEHILIDIKCDVLLIDDCYVNKFQKLLCLLSTIQVKYNIQELLITRPLNHAFVNKVGNNETN